MAAREAIAGGFAALYPILKAMEETGRARRGYFVEGLGGAQFACAGADDMLRCETADQNEKPLVLAANDPANAYGAALPWPTHNTHEKTIQPSDTNRPQRAAAALVILSGGKLLGYLNKTRTKLTTFLATEDPDRTRQKRLLASALAQRAKDRFSILIEQIDGSSPEKSSLSESLAAEGFKVTSGGYVHRG